MATGTYILGVVLAIASGIALAVQTGTNATLGKVSGRSFAATVSFSTGLACCLVYLGIELGALQGKRPTPAALAGAPWWAWIGGFLGALYVIVVIIFAHTLGSGTLASIVLSAQLVTAVLLDLGGLVGFPKRRPSWPRLVGAALLVAGVVLVCKFPGDLADDLAAGGEAAKEAGAAPAAAVQAAAPGARRRLLQLAGGGPPGSRPLGLPRQVSWMGWRQQGGGPLGASAADAEGAGPSRARASAGVDGVVASEASSDGEAGGGMPEGPPLASSSAALTT